MQIATNKEHVLEWSKNSVAINNSRNMEDSSTIGFSYL